MDEGAGPQYVFVVVSHKHIKDPYSSSSRKNSEYFSSILQLETPRINDPECAPILAPEKIKKIQVNEKDYVARFSQVQVDRSPIGWLFSPPSSSSSEDLYILPDCTLKDYYLHVGAPLHGFKVDVRNRRSQPIIPPTASKMHGHVVNREGNIYFMAHPDFYYETPDPVFECYDPVENKWRAIEPFPDQDVRPPYRSIAATAVWDDTILYFTDDCKIWAYNVHKNKWYIVKVKDDRCYNILGEAVVLENTIYALTVPEVSLNSVLALSIEKEEIDGDLVFECSLLSEILVRGMDQLKFEDAKAFRMTRHLVHLGKDNFCLVQSCNRSGLNRYQPIQLSSIKLTGKKLMTIMGVCVYDVEILSGEEFQEIIERAERLNEEYEFVYGRYDDITRIQNRLGGEHDQQFEVRLCFSLPECKTTAVKQSERLLMPLNPFSEDHASINKYKTEGNCICVRNVPPDATFEELERAMKYKFGCIQKAGMRVVMNNTGHPFAIAELESDIRAIKESSVKIGDGLSLVDCHKTSCTSSSGQNKFNNHCEVSQSKTICGGDIVEGGGAGNKLHSRSESSLMDDTVPQSLFVMVSWDRRAPGSISMLQLDTQNTNHEYVAPPLQKMKKKKMNRGLPFKPRQSFSSLETHLSQKEYVAHFSRPQGSAVVQWALTSSTCSESEEVYMFPYWDLSDGKIYTPMHGCIFNLRTKAIRQSMPPKANKFAGHVVSLDGCIYFMANPSLGHLNLKPAFECYDPFSNVWNALEPFPFHSAGVPTQYAVVMATIVWNKTILYNMCGYAIWAYDVEKHKWYRVLVEDWECYLIEGEAVVVDSNIYALAILVELVLALSIERIDDGVDLVFKCSVRSSIRVPGLKGISVKNASFDKADSLLFTRHLVRFGKYDFCVVESCRLKEGFNDYQPIQVTKIKLLEDNSMTVTDERVHYLRVSEDRYFKVGHCFSLPEYKITAWNTAQRLFNLDPYTAGLEKGHFSFCKQIRSHVYAIPSPARKASTIGDSAASERSNTNEEGRFIYVRNLPKDATFRQIEEKLKELGLIKDDGIQVVMDNTGFWSAIVEFVSETSKQSAIKASSIMIESRSLEIEDYPAPANKSDGCSFS